MGDKEPIANYIKGKDWETTLPPTKKEIARNVSTTKRTIEGHHTALKRDFGIEIKGPEHNTEGIGSRFSENRYGPADFNWEELMSSDKLEVRKLLMEMFLDDLRSITRPKKFEKKIEAWKKGKIGDDKLKEIAVEIPGKTLNEVENDILDLVSATAKEAGKKRKEEIRRKRIQNTKEISKDEMEDAVFGRFYHKPQESSKSREELMKNWEQGELKEVKSHVANALNLEKNSDIFEEKFNSVVDDALRRIREGEETTII